jgi:hypothetical protein
VQKVKRASVEGYEPYYGSDVEDAPNGLTPTGVTPNGDEEDKPSETEIDAMEEFEKQEKETKKNQVLRAILGGFQFTFKIEGICVRLFPKEISKRQNREIPSLEIDIGVIAVLLAIMNERVATKVILKEIKILEYYRREQMRAYSS